MTARARQKAGIQGVSGVRRALRKADESIRIEVANTIERLAKETVQIEKGLAPQKDGDLVSSITYVTSSDGLSAVIAPGIRGATTAKKRAGSYFGQHRASARTGKELRFSKRTNFDRFQFIKAYWLEVGTKEGAPGGIPAGKHEFVKPTFDAMKGKIVKEIGRAVDKALAKMMRGG